MEELAALEIPEYALILAEIAWVKQFRDRNFVVTSLEGFQGLCREQKRWVKCVSFNRFVAENYHMLCADQSDRDVAMDAFKRWPCDDKNTYAAFDPRDLPDAFRSIPSAEASRAKAIPGVSKALTEGS